MKMTFPPEHDAIEPDLLQPGGSQHLPVSITSSRNWHGRISTEFDDFRQTYALWRLVWTLSVFDIRLRYRGSILGPFWLTLSTAVMVGALGFLYSRLFHTDIRSYLPFLSLSLVLWNFISTLTAEGCTCFTQSESMIRAMRMPLSMHAARVVIRNFLVLAHNIVVIVAVFVIMRKIPGHYSVLIIPALGLWVIDAIAISLLLGVLCARFRDVPPIVASIMQIAFFVSPIIWSPTVLVHRGLGTVLIKWNPFFALLEIVRGPLLGSPLDLTTWLTALCYSLAIIVLAVVIFAVARPRIAYWI